MTEEKLTKNQRREKAREQARIAREAEKQREKRKRLMLQGGIVAVVLVILAIVALVLTQSMKPAGPGPKNMISGGVTFGEDLKVVTTPNVGEGEERKPRNPDWSKPPIDVVVYVDYMCPGCGAFEQAHSAMLENYVGAGDITLTVVPVNFQDPQSAGTKYSSRAANIVACVVDEQPDFAFKLHNNLLSKEVQPAQGSTGLTNEQLIEQAEAAGATATDELKRCVKDQRFAGFISGNWKMVSEKGLLDLAPGAQLLIPSTGQLQPADQPQRLAGTPTIIVNGQEWRSDQGDLENYILKLKDDLQGNTDEEKDSDS